MTQRKQTFEGQTSGTPYSQALSSSGGSDALQTYTAPAAGTVEFSTTQAFLGTSSLHINIATGNTMTTIWSGFSTTQLKVRFYIRWVVRPTTSGMVIGQVRDTASSAPTAGNIAMNSTGTLQVGGTDIGVLSTGVWYRVEAVFTKGATTADGQVRVAVYTGNDMPAVYTSTVTTANLGTVNFGQFRWGKLSSPFTAEFFMDQIVIDDSTADTSFIGPAGVNVAPTASAGSSQTVQRGAVVTLSPSEADSDGTIASRQWTVVSSPGSAPTLTGATTAAASFTAALAGKYVLQYVVTDDGGLTSTPSTVTIYAYPQTAEDTFPNAVTLGAWSKYGAGSTALSSVTDSDTTTGILSPTNPTSGQLVTLTLDPIGPGTITVYLSGRYVDAAVSRTVTLYKENGTTVVKTWTVTPTNSDAEVALTVDSAGLAIVPNATDRRALILTIGSAVS